VSIIFFEDQFTRDVNQKLHLTLRITTKRIDPTIKIHWPKTVKDFEWLASNADVRIFILDVMTRKEDLFSFDTGDPIMDTWTGIELLRRIRACRYARNDKSIIYIRSARTAESEIKSICYNEGANRCYRAGWDDMDLVSDVDSALRGIS